MNGVRHARALPAKLFMRFVRKRVSADMIFGFIIIRVVIVLYVVVFVVVKIIGVLVFLYPVRRC